MKAYCLGFHFSPDGSRVALILKNRGPVHLRGRWNGIGGKVENNETPHDAMRRECREEAGLDITSWEHVGKIAFVEESAGAAAVSYGGEVELFRCFDPREPVQKESEQVGMWSINELPDIVWNLCWILPMMLDGTVHRCDIRCAS